MSQGESLQWAVMQGLVRAELSGTVEVGPCLLSEVGFPVRPGSLLYGIHREDKVTTHREDAGMADYEWKQNDARHYLVRTSDGRLVAEVNRISGGTYFAYINKPAGPSFVTVGRREEPSGLLGEYDTADHAKRAIERALRDAIVTEKKSDAQDDWLPPGTIPEPGTYWINMVAPADEAWPAMPTLAHGAVINDGGSSWLWINGGWRLCGMGTAARFRFKPSRPPQSPNAAER